MKAKLEIRVWNDDGKRPDEADLAEMFQDHVEYIADLLGKGFTSGQVYDEEGDFQGWWEIKNED